MSTTTTTTSTRRMGRRWRILIPAILVIYIIAYIDRVNIGFGMSDMSADLKLDGAQAGFAAGVFFIGYVVLQVPGGWLAQRWSAKKLVFVLLLIWGLLAAASGFAQDFGQLVFVRFLLGLVEGAVQPALMVLISRWFPVKERGRAFSLFIMHNPIASIIAGPLSGVILMTGGWRELFIIEGVAGLVIGLVVWGIVAADSPKTARWLSERERVEIEELKAQDPVIPVQSDWRAAVRSGIVWRLATASLLIWLGFYGLQLWLPSLLKESFSGDLTIGLLAALPPIAAGIAIWFNGRGADKDGRYTLRIMVPLVIGGVVLILSTFVTRDQGFLIVLGLCVATACQLSFFGPFWSLASQRVPAAAVGVGFGIINGIGNLGGLFGPYLGGYLKDVTGNLTISSAFFGVAVIVAGVMIGTIRRAKARPGVPAETNSISA